MRNIAVWVGYGKLLEFKSKARSLGGELKPEWNYQPGAVMLEWTFPDDEKGEAFAEWSKTEDHALDDEQGEALINAPDKWDRQTWKFPREWEVAIQREGTQWAFMLNGLRVPISTDLALFLYNAIVDQDTHNKNQSR